MTTNTMSKAQSNYIAAKAVYDQLQKKYKRQTARPNEAVEQGAVSIEDWSKQVTDIEFDTGYRDAQMMLSKAEADLIEWGKQVVEAQAKPGQLSDLRRVLNEGPRLISVRQKLIDTLMRLPA